MTETAARYAPTPKPCPFCGCTDLVSNEWAIGDEDAQRIGVALDDFGECWAWECTNCLGSAPMASWDKRPDPWRHPPEMPLPGQRVLMIYKHPDGLESIPIVTTHSETFKTQPIVRWMHIPEIPA